VLEKIKEADCKCIIDDDRFKKIMSGMRRKKNE
jgi:hypothetical protein